MDTKRNRPTTEKEIFLAASQKESLDERASYLDSACNDDEGLRRRVEMLLAAEELDKSSPLERVTAALNPTGEDFDTSYVDITSHPPIGPYKLREQIGEGGMGVVYVAEQTEPVRRKVALKVIKPGMSSKDVVARFEAERQTLALMDHPHIARIFDGGTTDSGQPYFVMELVQGLPITEFCDQQRLATDQRLKLFATVCKAVQHAHQRGIIHRDIKPSNIIVAEIDAISVPKVIDFGVAKAINQQLINQTVYTQFSQMVGTPLYMSPEQASLGVVDVDTRSDVYSLGVLLYELLTGTTPFDRNLLKSAGFDEMRRIIREDEPPRPSAKVSTLNAQARSTVADRRRTDTRKLSRSLSGELDWLVMKALEKDRDRRYESASALAADVERYLEGDAVRACPPSAVYRLKKYATRHKGLLTTTALLVATLLVATAVSVTYAIRANRETARADAEARVAAAVNAFLHDDLLAQARPDNQPNPNVTLLAVVNQAAKTITDRFADQPLVEAAIRHTLAKTYDALGKYKEAAEHVDRALQLRSTHLGVDDVNTIQTALLSANVLQHQGNYLASRERLVELLSGAQRVLGPTAPVTLTIQHRLASVIGDQGDYAEAERITQEVLKTRRRTLGDEHRDTCASLDLLAIMYKGQAQYEKAEELLRETLDIRRRISGDEHPRTLGSMANLATVIDMRSRHKEAEELFLKVLEVQRRVLGDEHPDTLMCMHNLASTFIRMGRLEESEQLLREILEIRLRTLGKEHPDTLRGMNNLAAVYELKEQFEEAEKLFTETLDGRRKTLGDGHPETLDSQTNLANIYRKQRRFDESEGLYHQAIENWRRTHGEHNGNASYINAFEGLAHAYADHSRPEEAEKILRRKLAIQRRTLGDEHTDTLASMRNLYSIVANQGRWNEAEEPFKKLMSIEQRLGLDDTDTMFNLAVVLEHQNRFSEAEPLYRKVLQRQQDKLGNQHPLTVRTMQSLAHVSELQGDEE